jgi:hypothetical protein
MANPIFAAETSLAPTVTLDKAIHFLGADGGDVLVQPGTYQLEIAEEWLRLVPGERKDALLLEAIRTQHDENLNAAQAMSQSGDADEYRITLLLPGGNGLEVIGSTSGIRSRAVKRRLSSRTRIPKQQASRMPTQSTKSTVVQKSKPIPKSPVQPNDPLAQQVQTLEQQVSSLQNLVNVLQSQLNTMTSAIQVDAVGQITIGQAGTVTIQGSLVKIQAASITAHAPTSKFNGVVQSDTLITNSVISKTYTPGAGNIW